MKTGRDVPDRLKKLLTEAYRARESVEIDEGWQSRLMARIKEIGPVEKESCFTPSFARLVWRLVPYTAAVSAGLALLLAGLYFTTQYNVLQLATRDVEVLMLKTVLGG
jgi:hypothetical protein